MRACGIFLFAASSLFVCLPDKDALDLAKSIRDRDVAATQQILRHKPALATRRLGGNSRAVLQLSSNAWPAFGATYQALHVLSLPPTVRSNDSQDLILAAELIRLGARVDSRNAGGQQPVDVALIHGRDALSQFFTLILHIKGHSIPSAVECCLKNTPRTLATVLDVQVTPFSEDVIREMFELTAERGDWASVTVLLRRFGAERLPRSAIARARKDASAQNRHLIADFLEAASRRAPTRMSRPRE